jgi:leucine efflux protein
MGHMLGITNIWTYLLGTVAIILLPGPNSMYVLSVAARRGIRAGYAGACGVFVGDAVLMTLSAAGVASLLRAEPALFMIVKYVGAGYLCWIGVGMLRVAWRHWRRPIPVADEPTDRLPAAEERDPLRRALVVSLLNPKAILFFVSFFIQFVQPAYPHAWLSFLVLGVIAELVSAAYLTTLIFAGSYLAIQFRSRRALSTALTAGVAALFVGFAVKLATASLV